MAKEIPEEEKNYNKYPGEQVLILQDDLIKIGGKSFRLIKNYKGGFDGIALGQRYGHVFDKFDYIVGDWGHELLRLRGFYENDKNDIEVDERIDHLADYLQEYCAFGAKYFILHRERADGEVDEPFLADEEDLEVLKLSRQNQNNLNGHSNRDRINNRRVGHGRNDLGFSTVRPDAIPVESESTKIKTNSNNSFNKNKSKNNNHNKNNHKEKNSENKPDMKQRSNSDRRNRNSTPQKSEKKFVIRERKD
ncbi:MAG TPA: YutD family protein [Lactovum miscens]|uniref:YutD family protein n=1 Tax=Lactovum miscens TaxID=190387 RepID=UPI002ED9A451